MSGLEYLPAWPRIRSAISRDDAAERRIAALVAQMTLEEKLGQMIQPELAELTPEDVTAYKIGSALNGAGIWPGRDRHASVTAWVDTVDGYWQAAREAYRDRPFHIPFLWATDAVHGHNNVYGATVFPHNIGLGAACDPDLVRRIGAATAAEIAATGMDWTFAPTVTTPRDRRWGRYYEGYAEDPEIVHAYAGQMVRGLQGGAAGLRTDRHVIATVKHWVADGGTADGADRGTARCGEDLVRNIHAMGFFSALEAGAQAVMVSFSSWEDPANRGHTLGAREPYNFKVHGSRYLITDVLKDAMGFDGIVISDWDAHAEVSSCSIGDAGYAINAGLDVLMVAGRAAWQSVYHSAARDARDGVIPAARIDDAVTRVLRVKMRAGMWDKPSPSERSLAGKAGVLGCAEHQALSAEAARKSLVLLKNDGGALPLAREARVLAAGSGVDDIRKQAGGWTLSWQGDDVTRDDLPGCTTVADAIRAVAGAGHVVVDPALDHADPADFDVAVVVIGEDSYAEMRGTLKPWRSLAYADLKLSYARDVELLRRLRASGITVVTVLLTGRPLYVTEEINLSDAFVVAWLPGPHGAGITAGLYRAVDSGGGGIGGRLPASWPRRRDLSAVNRIPPHIPGYQVPPEESAPVGENEPLFPYGYGLSLPGGHGGPADAGEGSTVGAGGLAAGSLAAAPGDLGVLPLDAGSEAPPPRRPQGPLVVWDGGPPCKRFRFRIGGHNTWSRVDVSLSEPTDVLIVRAEPLGDPGRAQAMSLRFKGFPAFVYAESATGEPTDLSGYADAGGDLVFDVRVGEFPESELYLAVHDDYPAQPGVCLNDRLARRGCGEWVTLRVPLAELRAAGSDLRHVDVPFMLYTEGAGCVDIRGIRWEC